MPEDKKKRQYKKATISIVGMHCASCAVKIEKRLAMLDGVKQARVNYASEKAFLEYDPEETNISKIKKTIESLGYKTATMKLILPIKGMHCASCVARVEKALGDVPGVISAAVNLASEKATIEYIEDTGLADLKKAVRDDY